MDQSAWRWIGLFILACAARGVIAQAAAVPATPTVRERIEVYEADRELLERRWTTPLSAARRERMRASREAALAEIAAIDETTLATAEVIDLLLWRNRVRRSAAESARAEAKEREIWDLLSPLADLVPVLEARERMEPVVPEKVAAVIEEIARAIERSTADVAAGKRDATDVVRAGRAVRLIGEVEGAEREWFLHYDGYDPMFSWWLKAPQKLFAEALAHYRDAIRTRLLDARAAGDASLVGDPIGEKALLEELAFERIPYTSAELIAIAEKEFAWCDAEMEKAAKELGFDDWRKAQESVKAKHVPPGEQPAMVKRLAEEAIAFVESRDLVTIPALCREGWKMDMMSIERQRVNPYFTGGETISVSYPTDAMTHAEKLASMRDNCEPFSHATVQHELIPGHHLHGFMQQRFRPYRRAFETPFWIEGWALYWEMRLWDLGFARGPEDRIGALFWRKHRCARIIFSLSFHTGKMSAADAVNYLVDRVGHTRRSAEAEVRRSVGSEYSPLYQAAYMLGGLQIRALHREMVTDGKMTERAFHDAVLHENAIPIELIRAALLDRRPAKNAAAEWRFYDPPLPK